MCEVPDISLFVRIDCQAHSAHRDPKGVYRIDVHSSETKTKRVHTAMSTALCRVPFLRENLHRATMRVFNDSGDEIICGKSFNLDDPEEIGRYLGRTKDYPENIKYQ